MARRPFPVKHSRRPGALSLRRGSHTQPVWCSCNAARRFGDGQGMAGHKEKGEENQEEREETNLASASFNGILVPCASTPSCRFAAERTTLGKLGQMPGLACGNVSKKRLPRASQTKGTGQICTNDVIAYPAPKVQLSENQELPSFM